MRLDRRRSGQSHFFLNSPQAGVVSTIRETSTVESTCFAETEIIGRKSEKIADCVVAERMATIYVADVKRLMN